MKGLLIKDFLNIKNQIKVFFAFIIVFALVPNGSAIGYALFGSAMIAVSSITLDERSKWNYLASMMPYSPFDIVLSKYIFIYLTSAITIVFALIVQLVIGLFTNHLSFDTNTLFSIIGIVSAMLSLEAFILPLLFKFGVEKSRFIYIGIIVFLTAFIPLSSNNSMLSFYTPILQNLPSFIGIFFLAAIAINILSIILSTHIYKHKSFN